MNNKKRFLVVIVLFIVIMTTFTYIRIACKDNKVRSNSIIKKNISSKDANSKVIPVKSDIPVDIHSHNPTKLKVDWSTMELKNNNIGVPVLMYHSIPSKKGNDIQMSKDTFREQMKFLKDNGYITLTLDDIYNFLESNKEIPVKSVAITFDDGYVDNYTNAFPILKEFGFKATIFYITSNTSNPACLSEAELKEMQGYGIDIESHTVNHEHLSSLSYAKQLETLKGSKDYLEKLLDKKINFIAYPYGEYNKDTLKAVKEAGYTMALTSAGRWSYKTDGIYTLERVYISASADLKTFNERITNPRYKIK